MYISRRKLSSSWQSVSQNQGRCWLAETDWGQYRRGNEWLLHAL